MSDDSASSPDAVGFIGLGNMGWWMARNLRRAIPRGKTTLYIFDIVPSILDDFKSQFSEDFNDIICCNSAKEVGNNAVVTFVIVPEGPHVRDVFLNEASGLLSGVGVSSAPRSLQGKTFVDCSTIDPATSLAVAQVVSSTGAHFYDAPVSGGTAGAEAAKLTFMVGAVASDTHFQAVISPLLKLMGAHIFCLGAPSLGLVAKLSNNYLSGIIAIATSEAMNIGMRHGIDPKVLSDCFGRSSGQNWVNDTVNPVPGVCPNAVTSRGYKGGFKVQLMAKDVRLAVEAARFVGAHVVLGDKALETYVAAADDPRCRDRDSRVVYRWLGGVEPAVQGQAGEVDRKDINDNEDSQKSNPSGLPEKQ